MWKLEQSVHNHLHTVLVYRQKVKNKQLIIILSIYTQRSQTLEAAGRHSE